MILELPPGKSSVTIKNPRPKTDVNWNRDVMVTPLWAKADNLTLEIGIFNLTYTAKHPLSKVTISCSTVLTVLGKLAQKIIHYKND